MKLEDPSPIMDVCVLKLSFGP